LKVFSKERGEVYTPDPHEAFDRVSQKIRDIKKYRLKAANAVAGPRRVSQKRTSEYCIVGVPLVVLCIGVRLWRVWMDFSVPLLLTTRCAFFRFLPPPAQPAKRRRDPAEEGVKDKLILEMRAEITRLRANVMTAHEKIRTLEQIHAHDEERIANLQDELGIGSGSKKKSVGMMDVESPLLQPIVPAEPENDDGDDPVAKKPRAEPAETAEV